MTVCIAAISQGQSGNSIVLCCDSRLDHGYFGSTNYASKLRFVGTGWLSMISGRWEHANQLSRSIKEYLLQGANTPSEAITIVREAAKSFRCSAYFSEPGSEEALVTGFVNGQPIILHVTGEMTVDPVPFGAIGEGYNIASVMIHHRNYLQSMKAQEVAYIVYEAKRCSEKVGSVGKETTLLIQHPTDIDAPENSVNLDMFSMDGLRWLDDTRERLWLKDVGKHIKAFPKKCFVDPHDPTSTSS